MMCGSRTVTTALERSRESRGLSERGRDRGGGGRGGGGGARWGWNREECERMLCVCVWQQGPQESLLKDAVSSQEFPKGLASSILRRAVCFQTAGTEGWEGWNDRDTHGWCAHNWSVNAPEEQLEYQEDLMCPLPSWGLCLTAAN